MPGSRKFRCVNSVIHVNAVTIPPRRYSGKQRRLSAKPSTRQTHGNALQRREPRRHGQQLVRKRGNDAHGVHTVTEDERDFSFARVPAL